MFKFLLYVTRWQLSTPILWLVVSRLGTGLEATVLANLIGASIFFWVDRLIFRRGSPAVWETIPSGVCADCGGTSQVRRLVLAPSGRGASSEVYDRRDDPSPEYRCRSCSEQKLRDLRTSKRVGEAVLSVS